MTKITLQYDVYGKNGALLLSKGRVIELTDEVKARLSRRGILDEVLAQDQKKNDELIQKEILDMLKLEDTVKKEVKVEEKEKIAQLGKEMSKKLQFVDKQSLDKAVTLVQELIHSQKSKKWYPHFLTLTNHVDWIYAHSINTALISCIIGNELNYSPYRMKELGIGALLHDIGIIVLPRSVLNKEKSLTVIENAMLQSHCEIGFSLLQDSDLSTKSKNIILQHHENKDGTGYPNNLFDKDILEEAKIVMIAETLDTNTTARMSEDIRDIDAVLEEMLVNEKIYEKSLVSVIAKQMHQL